MNRKRATTTTIKYRTDNGFREFSVLNKLLSQGQ